MRTLVCVIEVNDNNHGYAQYINDQVKELVINAVKLSLTIFVRNISNKKEIIFYGIYFFY